MAGDTNINEALESFLISELHAHHLALIPTKLVKISALLLTKMLAEHSNFEMIKIIGLGSVWAWSFDEISDDYTIPLEKRLSMIDEYEKLVSSMHFKGVQVIPSSVPIAAQLLLSAINRLFETFKLTSLDGVYLKQEILNCLSGARYEVINAGKVVDLETSLHHRSYSYATPMYGAMLYVGEHHITSREQMMRLENFLRLFGRATRLRNDLSTYQKEKAGGEINIVKVLSSRFPSEQEAINASIECYNKSEEEYALAGNGLPRPFVTTIDNFKRVHHLAYEIKDIRSLDLEDLSYI